MVGFTPAGTHMIFLADVGATCSVKLQVVAWLLVSAKGSVNSG